MNPWPNALQQRLGCAPVPSHRALVAIHASGGPCLPRPRDWSLTASHAMKTSTLIVLSSWLASVIVAAEPPGPSQMHLIDYEHPRPSQMLLIDREPPRPAHMHLIDRNRIQTNTPPADRVSVAYDLIRRERVSYSEYVPSRR
jgi:hypothetical protein